MREDFGKYKGNAEVTIAKISPERAREILKNNWQKNRPLRARAVQEYAQKMKDGMWDALTPIVIDENGILKDGQHRLNAVVKSGTSQDFIIVTNVSKKMFGFDRGMTRSIKDSLVMGGKIDGDITNRGISAAGILVSLLFGENQKKNELYVSNLINAYHDQIIKAVRIVAKGGGDSICRKAGIVAAVIPVLASKAVSEEDLSSFFEAANTGFGSSERYFPAIALRNTITKAKNEGIKKTGNAVNKFYFEITDQAIADFIKGKKRKNVYTNGTTALFNKVKNEMTKAALG